MNSRLLALAVGTALTASAAGAGAATIDLAGRPVDLALSPIASSADQAVVGSQADLTTNLLSLETRLHLGLEAGPRDPGAWRSGRWNGSRMNLGAVWSPSDRARVELNAGSQRRRDLDLISPVDIADARREVLSQDTQARASATLSPYSPVSLTFGGEASTRAVRTDSSGDPISDRLWTRSREVFSTVTWRLSPTLQIEGGGRLHSLGVDWAGAGDGTGDYDFVEPQLAGALTPWSGGAWRLSVARVVSPLNTDQFIGFAKAALPGSRTAFAPDQAWRYQAAFSQQLAVDTAVTATLTRSRLQSLTDFGPTGAGEAPMNIGGGESQEIAGQFTVPMSLFGLGGTTFNARTAWRSSQVRDPFTGQTRRASGEAPYDAQLSLSQAMDRMRWGVTAQAVGSARIYQMSQVVTRTANAGLGAFVEYNPGPLRVRLNLENVVGGERLERTTYYDGSRAFGNATGYDQTRTADRVIGLTLTRPLN